MPADVFLSEPYERTLHLRFADTRVIRRFLSIENRWERFLYKYKNCNYSHLRNLLVDSCFYMSSRHQLNDPFDVRSSIEFGNGGIDRSKYLNKIFKENKTRHKDRKLISKRLDSRERIQEAIKTHLERAVDTTGVHSFATSPKNLLLWSHYADSHKGVCLIYETAKDLDTFIMALPVGYSKSFPVINYTPEIEGDLIKKAFLTKAIDWQYEKERRIFRRNSAGHYMAFSPRALVGLILGANISSTDEAMVRDLLLERKARQDNPVRLYRAICQNSEYSIKIYCA